MSLSWSPQLDNSPALWLWTLVSCRLDRSAHEWLPKYADEA